MHVHFQLVLFPNHFRLNLKLNSFIRTCNTVPFIMPATRRYNFVFLLILRCFALLTDNITWTRCYFNILKLHKRLYIIVGFPTTTTTTTITSATTRTATAIWKKVLTPIAKQIAQHHRTNQSNHLLILRTYIYRVDLRISKSQTTHTKQVESIGQPIIYWLRIFAV